MRAALTESLSCDAWTSRITVFLERVGKRALLKAASRTVGYFYKCPGAYSRSNVTL